MEFFYYCLTCSKYRRNAPPGTVSLPSQIRWCTRHQVLLPVEVGDEHLICCDFSPADPRATEWAKNIAQFPSGELWSFEMYRPAYKFVEIAELPRVNPSTGEVIES